MANTVKNQIWLSCDGIHQHAYNVLLVMSDGTLFVQPEGAETTYWLYITHRFVGVLENERTHEIRNVAITKPYTLY